MTEKTVSAVAEKAGLDLATVKDGIRRLLPILKTVAKLTPTKADDAAVAFLDQLLAE